MSNEESKNSKYNQLIGILAEKFGLTGKEIAGILWLTLKRQEHSNINVNVSNGDTQTDDTPHREVVEAQKPPQPKENPVAENISSSRQPPSESSELARKVDIISKPPTGSTSCKTRRVRVPDPPSIPESLKLTRSLQALILGIDSGRRVVLDETKSAERTAAEGFFAVVLKSKLELLLELALVVDESRSMLIWRHTINELKTLLERSGFFRDVRTWGLVTDPKNKQKVHFRPGIGKTANKQRSANHREFIDPEGRRLILVISDCVSVIWRNGALTQALKDWTNSQPVAIIQMLPDWLWLRTGLVTGASVILGSLAPGVANKELLIKELLLWKDIELDAGIKVPVLSLQPEVAVNWSRMVAGKSDANASGFVFSRELPKKSSNDKPQSESENNLENQTQNITQNRKSQIEDSQDRVYRFRMTASPMARKLAGLLAAAPIITLPVVRLIQNNKKLFDEKESLESFHIAEVFLGGLLKNLTTIETDTNPDMVQYDFMHPEIRNILLATSPLTYSADVLDEVSEYVTRNLLKNTPELMKDFVAWLKAPDKPDDKDDNQRVKAFAKVALQILKELGGGYETFANELGDPRLNAEFPESPLLQTFEFEFTTVSLEEVAKEAELHQEINDPYILAVPLTQEQEIFSGRDHIGTRIEQLILDRRNPSLLLYGQRRMGKTSLLCNLGKFLPNSIIPMFVDLQGAPSSANNYTDFLYNLARGMITSAKKEAVTLPPLTRETLKDDPFTCFDEWLDRVEKVLKQNTALLMLDEFEVLDGAITKGRFDEQDVLGMLRHLIQHRPRFKLMLAGSHTIEEYQRWASYLINVQVVHISYLEVESARKLIERPVKDFMLRYEADAVDRMLKLTRCHPFLVQLLCSEIVAYKNEQDPSVRRLATLADVEAAVMEALNTGSFFFADIQNNQVNAVGLDILKFMAARGEGAVVNKNTILQEISGVSESDFQKLLQRELIEKVENEEIHNEEVGDGYRFQVELIRRWFAAW